MTWGQKKQITTYSIAAVWFINGAVCKLLNLVPRHREIVGAIMGNEHEALLTTLIGIGEIFMAIWVISGYRERLNAITQIVLIVVMNAIEFAVVPELLLWGRLNAVFALLFVFVVFYNQFGLNDSCNN
jgi:hypothetical protein